MQNGKSVLELALFEGHDLASAELLKAEDGDSDVSVRLLEETSIHFPVCRNRQLLMSNHFNILSNIPISGLSFLMITSCKGRQEYCRLP